MHVAVKETPEGLALVDLDDARSHPVRLALDVPRRLTSKDDLWRAIGVGRVRTVVDATAGLGRDAASLAALGLDVIAVERAPLLVELWRDAERRGRLPRTLRFEAGDARDVLRSLTPSPDAVLLDPMYPAGPRRAAPGRALVVLRDVCGDDLDAALVLAVARQVAERVVVKRPRKAAPIAPAPTHTWSGTSTRFDLYVGQRTAAAASG
jgi:16S rRNA (guanine1516-N2)-methyltransferase